ncbi:MAG: hypothetical protein ABIH23_12990 [bacterium]
MFKPKHTFASVVQRLSKGLENETILLREESLDGVDRQHAISRFVLGPPSELLALLLVVFWAFLLCTIGSTVYISQDWRLALDVVLIAFVVSLLVVVYVRVVLRNMVNKTVEMTEKRLELTIERTLKKALENK